MAALTPRGAVVQQLVAGRAIQLPATLPGLARTVGAPLPDRVRQKMESFFGTGFGDVRVHVGPQASWIGALAFTHGSRLYFAPGQFNPHTVQGQRLLGHELSHVVQQRAGLVRNPFGSGIALVYDERLEAEADRLSLGAARHPDPAPVERRGQGAPFPPARVAQARFFELTPAGRYVWWKSPMSWVGGEKLWKPVIDPATGRQQLRQGYGVWFRFDKTGLTRQKVKGDRPVAHGDTTGLTLGDQAAFGAAGVGTPWPGSRNWPGAMEGAYRVTVGAVRGSARNQRAQVAGAPGGESAWGHQLAMQWGGPAAPWNAASATNDAGAGAYAQELYQTAVEDAVTYVAAHHGIPLSEFRIKHTAYLYPGTKVAKFMRIKIYHRTAGGAWVKLVDQVTPDFATFLAGGRSQAGTARRAFQMQVETQLRGSTALRTTRGTAPGQVMSWDAAATPTRAAPPPPPARRCFLSTACVEARGLPDHCEELQILRAFRDEYVRLLPAGEGMIEEYYRIAPAIVAEIQKRESSRAALQRLYEDLVLASVRLIRTSDFEAALAVYRWQVAELREEFLAP
jgi:hypothetical protein